MEEKEAVQPAHPLVQKRKHFSCQPLHLLYILSALTLTSGLAIIVWWVYSSDREPISIDIISRSTWEAKPVGPAASRPLCITPPNMIVIMESFTDKCFTIGECSRLVRRIQETDLRQHHDISYNFLIGSDGNVYEGRGWGIVGAYASLVQNKAIGIALIGNSENEHPSEKILEVCQKFIEEAVRRKKLNSNYKLVALRQVSSAENPKENVYNVIKQWPHWTQCQLKGCAEMHCNKANHSDY